MKPEIIIDQREDRNLIRNFLKKKIDIKIKHLITADIIIYGKDYHGHNISVGIERKTQSDFLNSIIDKRIIKQLIGIKENFSIPLLIIEGSENIYSIRNFHPNSIRGMLSSIALDLQIPIIQTKSINDTIAFIETIIKRFESPRKNISLLKKRKPVILKEKQEYLVESLPGIGPSIAKSLLKKFGSIINIMKASKEDLKKVEKLGDKKAEEIKKVTDSPY